MEEGGGCRRRKQIDGKDLLDLEREPAVSSEGFIWVRRYDGGEERHYRDPRCLDWTTIDTVVLS